jgi:glutamyl/glutaminyl-tRNA synthetase
MIKVRFAPSPTGIPHIGGTRTALFNFLFAKSQNGEFLLRIEDTDQKRLVKESEKEIFKILKWLKIEPSPEIMHQSERLDIYKKYVKELLEKKVAYEKDGAVWVNVPDDKTFEWVDLVGNKKISFKGETQEDFVILKSDSFPTYHLANVIDDHLTGITHVLRGEEWISSTPKHLYLYESFGWEPPFFAHLPVILGTDHTKLSKRHGAKSALDYKAEGYLKEAILNFMALLGWNPGGDKEIMNMDEMISLFKLEKINTANPIFDIKKLEWLNGVWIRSLSPDDLKIRLLEFYNDDKEVLEVLKSTKANLFVSAGASRMKTLLDFKALINTKSSRQKTKEEEEISKKLLKFLEDEFKTEILEDENFLAALKKFSKNQNIPFKTIYFLLSGKDQGIGLLELNQIFGKEFFVKNLKS